MHDDDPSDGVVVFPEYSDSTLPDTVRFDVSGIRGTRVDLFTRSGSAAEARVASVNSTTWDGDRCTEWPLAKLESNAPGSALPTWSVGFLHGRAQPVAVDSIEALPRADSARLAADLTRLASTLPDDTARTFRAIPFSVRLAFRFRSAPAVDAVVSDVVRRLNQEANPLEQHTLIIAERDSADAQAPWRVSYVERSAGSEETLEIPDVLAVVRLGTLPRVALLVDHEGYETTAYSLLERTSEGQWERHWSSAHTGC